MFSFTFHVISRKFGLLFGQCSRCCENKNLAYQIDCQIIIKNNNLWNAVTLTDFFLFKFEVNVRFLCGKTLMTQQWRGCTGPKSVIGWWEAKNVINSYTIFHIFLKVKTKWFIAVWIVSWQQNLQNNEKHVFFFRCQHNKDDFCCEPCLPLAAAPLRPDRTGTASSCS